MIHDDYVALNQTLLSHFHDYVPHWLPAGKIINGEYTCGDLTGKQGTSLQVSTETGKWQDHARPGDSGIDLISLYAAVYAVSNSTAFRELSEKIARSLPAPAPPPPPPKPGPPPTPPPKGTPFPELSNTQAGKLQQAWTYRTVKGDRLFIIARYKTEEGAKTFLPWSYADGGWTARAYPAPRPIYNLHLLARHPNRPVVIVEGEKAADAAQAIMGEHYTATTWAGGSSAYATADWTPLKGRTILLWPDADSKTCQTPRDAAKYKVKEGERIPYPFQPGPKAMDGLSHLLNKLTPGNIKLLDVSDLSDGWDAADFEGEFDQLVEWARPRAKVYSAGDVVRKAITQAAVEMLAPPKKKQQGTPESTMSKQQLRGIAGLPPEPTPITITHAEPPAHVTEPLAPEPGSAAAIQEAAGVSMSAKTGPHPTASNVRKMLNHTPNFKGRVWYDSFTARYKTNINWTGGGTTPVREWSDSDDRFLTAFFQEKLGFTTVPEHIIRAGLLTYADQHVKNEAREYFGSLTWDQKPRCENFLATAFGADDTEYTRAASKNWWVSMAARVLNPGCKNDCMIILEGFQGTGKSTALDILAGGWFGENNERLGSKDFAISLQGKLIVEFAELDYFSTSDIDTLKRVVSSRIDRFRPPYAKTEKDFPRQCVFVGTTNKKEYLQDETGARRFWPVHTTEANLKYIKENRDQLFAEAATLHASGTTWWEMPTSATTAQEARRVHSENEGAMLEWALVQEEFTMQECAFGALKIDIDKFYADTRIQKIMQKIFRAKKFHCRKKNSKTYWRHPDRPDPYPILPARGMYKADAPTVTPVDPREAVRSVFGKGTEDMIREPELELSPEDIPF